MLPKSFICEVILACHDDSGHLGMERTLGLLQERFFWPKVAEDVHMHICTCDRCLRFKQPQEKSEMHPILVSYPMELVHLDFLTLEGKADDNRSVNILTVTPKIPLDIEMGVALIEQGDTSHQNYVKKLKTRLKWAYQVAQENNQKESECLKKYYDRRMRCMSLKPDHLVLVHAKAPSPES